MPHKPLRFRQSVVLMLILILSACSSAAPAPTSTPEPTSTSTMTPTQTPTATSTPKPTMTPNQTATQRVLDVKAEIQSYVDRGYLETTNGRILRFADFEYEWAQLEWYQRFWLDGSAYSNNFSDFVFNAHFRWSSAYRNADISGCGVAFAIQPNDDHYAVFLDRSKVLFVKTDYYYDPIGPTRGTGLVKFDNPFEKSAEADFTLLVKDASAYVLVNDELVGEYALAQSRGLKGQIMLALISGTNKDFGTRCEISNIHIWEPE